VSLDFLIGLLLGSSISVLVFPLALKRYLKNKIKLRQLISEIYHRDILPEVCRTEGMLMLHELEPKENSELKDTYAAMALKSVRRHKKHVMDIIKQYEPFQ
jgi:hypothetical protein